MGSLAECAVQCLLVVGWGPGEHLSGLGASDGGADLVDAGLWCHGSLGGWGSCWQNDLGGGEVQSHDAFFLKRK